MKHSFRVGRSSDSDVVLADDSVSRRHALLEISGREIEVVDCDSTGGTWIVEGGGARRVGRAAVAAATVLRLGDVEIAVGDLLAAIRDRHPGLVLPAEADRHPSSPPEAGRPSPPPGAERRPSPPPPSRTSTRLVRCECGAIIRHGTLCPECHR